ncbi:MAG: hypothetical protein HYZ92_05310 [Candidatus Omnitrophica bacterium]|nr:hypothetical protein [Candidatus Omnitrophota bacterium]
MRRGLLIGLIGAGVLCVVLAVALAVIGSRFDEVRLDQEELSGQVDDLEAENDTLRKDQTALQSERDKLVAEREQYKTQTDTQLKTIEQLKTELERARKSGSAGTPAAGTATGS